MHIPRSFCGNCNMEMIIKVTGLCIETLTKNDVPYYKIYCDMFVCPMCGCLNMLTADKEVSGNWNDNYDHWNAKRQVKFADDYL